ncbi:MAG: hypothetical protein ACK5N8_04960 [Alphaproteobacteria bacterium]
MKKSIFTTSIFIFLTLISSFALAQGRYVRKQIKPSVYIPNSALDKQEKLPEFYYPTQNNLKEAIKDFSDEETKVIEVKTEYVPAPEKTVKVNKESVETPTPVESNKFSEMILAQNSDIPPLYTLKYDEYISDLKIIAETSNIPDNQLLKQDLAKMSSNEKIKVDKKFGNLPK